MKVGKDNFWECNIPLAAILFFVILVINYLVRTGINTSSSIIVLGISVFLLSVFQLLYSAYYLFYVEDKITWKLFFNFILISVLFALSFLVFSIKFYITN